MTGHFKTNLFMQSIVLVLIM